MLFSDPHGARYPSKFSAIAPFTALPFSSTLNCYRVLPLIVFRRCFGPCIGPCSFVITRTAISSLLLILPLSTQIPDDAYFLPFSHPIPFLESRKNLVLVSEGDFIAPTILYKREHQKCNLLLPLFTLVSGWSFLLAIAGLTEAPCANPD